MGNTEVDGGSRRVVGIHAEAHAQQLDVCLDEEGRIHVDFTLCVCLGADIETHGCTTLSALQ